ncbi:hypothetical protein A9C19_00325 [Bacillus weihaiensis]|uniref:Uncharacterized protein n=1 Tax=Bacillus weihaiensis TaxID=1547283 RepID=A0A1L3MLX5_9BACI|nr:hypothetical protein A9C19_00325 [Bacillus weihaiensis]
MENNRGIHVDLYKFNPKSANFLYESSNISVNRPGFVINRLTLDQKRLFDKICPLLHERNSFFDQKKSHIHDSFFKKLSIL